MCRNRSQHTCRGTPGHDGVMRPGFAQARGIAGSPELGLDRMQRSHGASRVARGHGDGAAQLLEQPRGDDVRVASTASRKTSPMGSTASSSRRTIPGRCATPSLACSPTARCARASAPPPVPRSNAVSPPKRSSRRCARSTERSRADRAPLRRHEPLHDGFRHTPSDPGVYRGNEARWCAVDAPSAVESAPGGERL